jgi:hypothetical protein
MTTPEQVTADRLTDVLRREGILHTGRVEEISIHDNPAFNSALCHLRVKYSLDASPGAPRALILKRNLPEGWAREAGKSEVAFYTEAGLLNDRLPMIVPCYEAVYDPKTGDSHLLFLDLSESHEPLVTRDDLIDRRGVPPNARLEAAVDALALFHAYWWEHPSLADGTREVSGWYGTRERFDDTVARRRQEWATFRTGSGADVAGDIGDLYEHLLERLSGMWDRGLGQRITSGRALTLVHGDCFLSQFLWPREGVGQTYLVDWQGAYTDFASIDLTHLLAAFWTPQQRHEGGRERRLLERYLVGLQAGGVTAYDWQTLTFDYRLLLIYMVLYPVWDAVDGTRKSYWWPKMQCLTSAYRDWACQDLLA